MDFHCFGDTNFKSSLNLYIEKTPQNTFKITFFRLQAEFYSLVVLSHKLMLLPSSQQC